MPPVLCAEQISMEARARKLAKDEDFREPDGGFWVFGYGSLMWRPGFPFVERRLARLSGFARAFCLWSIQYRGTPENPGLVLGLKQDPDCDTRGVAFRVPAEAADDARAYLVDREMMTASYQEAVVPLATEGGEIRGIAYVVDQTHPQFAGNLTLEEQARVIASSVGPMGRNCAYLFNTLEHLRHVGVNDSDLSEMHQLQARVRALQKNRK
jgi:cation transport protein ChaC